MAPFRIRRFYKRLSSTGLSAPAANSDPAQLFALTDASDSDDSLMAISLSWPLGFSRQARFRPQLAHRRFQPRSTCYHGAVTARWPATHMPIVKPSWRRTLHRTSRSSTKLRSVEILTSTSTGAHIKPLDPVLDPALDKPIDPELCSLHAASSLIEPQLRPSPCRLRA